MNRELRAADPYGFRLLGEGVSYLYSGGHVVDGNGMREASAATKRNARGCRRAQSWPFASFLAIVALAVLVWGTAYKTSLYKAPQAGRAPAKLCTRASDASKAHLDRALEEPVFHPVHTGVLTALYAALYPPVRALNPPRHSEDDHTPAYLRSSPALFYRPPPPFLHLT